MTIQLTQARIINGAVAASGSQHTLAESVEADFITNKWATRVGAAPNQGGAINPAMISTDANNNTVLVGAGGLPFSPANSGHRTVLFGDSMTDSYEDWAGYTTSYNTTTGVLTVTSTSNHGLITGTSVGIFHHSYPSLRAMRYLPITVTSNTVFTMTLADIPQDIPNGATSTFVHRPNWRSSQSFVHWWQLRNNNALDIVNNAGHSGNMSGFAYDIIDSEILAYSPKVVIFQMPGINDQADAQTYTFDQTSASQKAIITKLANSVPIVIIGTTTPVATGEARGTVGVMQRTIELNNAWMEHAKQFGNVYVYDSYGAIVDPTNSGGLALSTLLAGDFIHYHVKGAIKVCKLLEGVTARVLPPLPNNILPKSALDSHSGSALSLTSVVRASNVVTVTSTSHRRRVGQYAYVTGATPSDANGRWKITSTAANTFTFTCAGADGAITGATISTADQIFINPTIATTTGGLITAGHGITGAAADGFKIENTSGASGTLTAVASVAAASSGFGNEQLLVVSAAAAGDRPTIGNEAGGTFTTYMIPGFTYQLDFVARIASANWANTAVSEVYAVLDLTMASGARVQSKCLTNWDGTTATTITEDMTLDMKFPELTVPLGDTISYGFFSFYPRAAGTWSSNLTIGLSQIGIRIVA